ATGATASTSTGTAASATASTSTGATASTATSTSTGATASTSTSTATSTATSATAGTATGAAAGIVTTSGISRIDRRSAAGIIHVVLLGGYTAPHHYAERKNKCQCSATAKGDVLFHVVHPRTVQSSHPEIPGELLQHETGTTLHQQFFLYDYHLDKVHRRRSYIFR